MVGWCSGQKHEAIDWMPADATVQEREQLAYTLDQAARRGAKMAQQMGKGPRVMAELIKREQTKARDEAHDRYHLRKMNEALGVQQEQEEPVPEYAYAKPTQSEDEE